MWEDASAVWHALWHEYRPPRPVAADMSDMHTGSKSTPTEGSICDCEMMLLGKLFCLLSVVTSAQVT